MNFASGSFPALTLTGRSANPEWMNCWEVIRCSEYAVEERSLIVFEQDATADRRPAAINNALILRRIRFFWTVKKLLEIGMIRNLMENLLFDIDWRLGPDRDSNRVTRTRID